MSVVVDQGGELYSLMVDQVGEVLSLRAAAFERNPPTLDPLWRDWRSLSTSAERFTSERHRPW